MDLRRKRWNEQQHALRLAFKHPREHGKAVDLFLSQHSLTHASNLSGERVFSFEDELWDGLEDSVACRVSPKEGHSIVWCIWHLSRCEDITMNMLVAGAGQLLLKEDWFVRMKVTARDTGNAMDAAGMVAFSTRIDIPSLRAYRLAVGRQTRQVVAGLPQEEFNRKVDPLRLHKVLEEGAVLASEQWLVDYWSGLTVAGLLLMPPTRHSLVHLNESLKIKKTLS